MVLDDWVGRLLRSRELCYRLPGSPKAADGQRSRAAKPSPEGREDRRRSAAEPRTVAPLRAGRRWATGAAAMCEVQQMVVVATSWLGSDGHSGSLTIAHQSGRGHAGDPDAGHLFALGAHGGVRPQPGGFNHLVDVATEVGVMPLHELAPWLCPIRVIRPARLARGSGCVRRAGRRRP